MRRSRKLANYFLIKCSVHSPLPEDRRAAAHALAGSAEGESRDSNIDSAFERVVNVFLTRPVRVLSVIHGWLRGAGCRKTLNRKNRFAVSVLVRDSQSLLTFRNSKLVLHAHTNYTCIRLCYSRVFIVTSRQKHVNGSASLVSWAQSVSPSRFSLLPVWVCLCVKKEWHTLQAGSLKVIITSVYPAIKKGISIKFSDLLEDMSAPKPYKRCMSYHWVVIGSTCVWCLTTIWKWN